MNSSEIARRLAAAKTPQEAIDCVNAADPRRAEIYARLAVLSPQPSGGPIQASEERRKADLRGPEAMKVLEDEIETLRREIDHLGVIQREGHEKAEALRIAALRDAYPAALRSLPKEITALRKILLELDIQLARLNATGSAVAAYFELGERFPFTDDELVELYAIRDELWTPRTVAVILVPGLMDRREDFPKSWDRHYITRGPAQSPTLIERRAPQQIVITDYVRD